MKKLRFIAILMLSLGFMSQAFSQDLWQSSETGMNIEQVKVNFPDAIVPVKIDKFGGGSEALLIIPSYKIGSNNFKVQFLFKSNSLTSVRMELIDGSANVAFNSVKKLLKTKYGEPLDASSNSMSSTISWLNNGTTINLTNFMNKLVINYKADEVVEADKL